MAPKTSYESLRKDCQIFAGARINKSACITSLAEHQSTLEYRVSSISSCISCIIMKVPPLLVHWLNLLFALCPFVKYA